MIMRVDRYSRGTMLPICMYSASLEWAPKPDRPMPSMTGPRAFSAAKRRRCRRRWRVHHLHGQAQLLVDGHAVRGQREAAVAGRAAHLELHADLDSGRACCATFPPACAPARRNRPRAARASACRGLARDDVAVGAGLGHGPVQLQAFFGLRQLVHLQHLVASSYSALMPPSGRAPACEVLPCTVRRPRRCRWWPASAGFGAAAFI